MVVGRSQDGRGHYLDERGKNMAEGGGTLVLQGNDNWAGLGHNSAYTFDGKDYLVFHAYETADNGLQKLKILDRKSTRLNSSHVAISYAVFCLKKQNRATS